MTKKLPPHSTAKKSPQERRIARQKRVQTLLIWLGYPSSGIGIAAAIALFKAGKPILAIFTLFASIGVVFLAIAAKFVSEVINRVLDRIEERLEEIVDPFASWIVEGLEDFVVKFWWSLTDKFQGKYYQQLIYDCRDYQTYGLKTKGEFTLDLAKIFVPLRVSPKSAEKISTKIIRSNVGNENLTIWDFLVASEKQRQFRRLAIIGAPGSGKTTLLKDLTLTYAQNRQRRQNRKAPKFIPILIYLRDVREIIAKKNPSLPTVIEQQKSISKLKPRQGWFEYILTNKLCLVMLDGLDEVANDKQRQAVSKWVNLQINKYRKANFILTSRPFGYLNAPVEDVKTILDVQPFNLSQMEQFLQNWYRQREIMSRLGKEDKGVLQAAKRQADDLIERIKNDSDLAILALNPLLLTMIATVHCYRGALPGRRVELYKEICDVLLGKRDLAKGIDIDLTAEQQKAILQVLALGLMEQNTREFSSPLGSSLVKQKLADVAGNKLLASDFLENIKNRSGLLVERENKVFEFAHKSFQEYLAAVQIKELNQENLLINHIDDSWWEETIHLYAAQSDATNLVKAALQNPQVTSLKLALDCCDEGLSVNAQVKENLEQEIAKGLESPDLSKFTLAAQVKLSRRLSNFLRIDENLEIDSIYLTCAEYQLFVNNQLQNRKRINLPKFWKKGRFATGEAQNPVTDITWRDANRFCAWLSLYTYFIMPELSNIHYRLLRIEEKQKYPAQDNSWLAGSGIRLVRFKLLPCYSKLANFLAAQRWKEADNETFKVMLEIANRKSIGYLDKDNILKFPCEDLRIINQLWLDYSKEHFGFSVQKDIWLKCGGQPGKYNDKVWIEFCDRVGWRKKGSWLKDTELSFKLIDTTSRGHLPFMGRRIWGRKVGSISLFSRRDL